MTSLVIEKTARVTAVHRERFSVAWETGVAYARVKMGAYKDADTLSYPTVGDLVTIRVNDQGDSLIVETQPRKSLFSRKIAGKVYGEQAVAANFDEVFILSSLNQDFSARRIERYAALAWQSGGVPVIVLTKKDLVESAAQQEYEAAAAAPGTDVYTVSAKTGEGMEALRQRLGPGRAVVLLGSSGVGKSSLVNALAQEEIMETSGVREDDDRGRHTTTHRQLITLSSGAVVMDTPGMREIGLWNAEEGLREAFGDIDELARGCRFRDCAHMTEPGCAVKQAIEEGVLEEKRLKNYHKLQREAARRRKPQ